MHADELEIPLGLVSGLVAGQFPEWAALPVEPMLPWGTDNALFRLGDDKIVRLPRIPAAAGQVAKDARWLPELAPRLPLAIPEVLATGIPTDGYPWRWGVYRRLGGETLPPQRIPEVVDAAVDIARFLAALRGIETTGGPAAGPPNTSRGVPLATRDDAVRVAIAALGTEVDGSRAAAVWESALGAEWHGRPVWLHGDLMPGNLLVVDGRLSAVIDFSCLCVGDPACDLMVAWMFLTTESRAALRRELEVDDSEWARGCGWALSCALIAIPYYRVTNPTLTGYARRTLDEVLADPAV